MVSTNRLHLYQCQTLLETLVVPLRRTMTSFTLCLTSSESSLGQHDVHHRAGWSNCTVSGFSENWKLQFCIYLDIFSPMIALDLSGRKGLLSLLASVCPSSTHSFLRSKCLNFVNYTSILTFNSVKQWRLHAEAHVGISTDYFFAFLKSNSNVSLLKCCSSRFMRELYFNCLGLGNNIRIYTHCDSN